MLPLLLGLSLAGSSASDEERYTRIAHAADQVSDALEASGCTRPRGYRDRAIARLRMAEELPWSVVELSYSRLLPLFESGACAKEALEPPEGATAYRVPTVPGCAVSAAEDEIATAGWLADRGYEDAGNAVAELANRWNRTQCPRSRPRHQSWSQTDADTWCSCGGKRIRPEDVWFGYGASADELRFELDLARSGFEVPNPLSDCPVGCIATDPMNPRRRARTGGQLQSHLLEAEGRAIEVVNDAGAGVSRPLLKGVLEALPADCHGTIEWLGEWVPYDDYSACLVDAIPAGWEPRGWVVVDA